MNQPPSEPDRLKSLQADLNRLDQQPPSPQSSPLIRPNPKFAELLHPPQSTEAADSLEDLLEDLAELDAETERAAAQQQEAERQAVQERQRQATRIRQAERWLEQLDQNTDEAAWFEAFAANYSSRVEAAIDYLGLAT